MTLQEFDSLPAQIRQTIFPDMQALYDITNTCPAGVEELRILAEWHKEIGGQGDHLRKYLSTLAPRSSVAHGARGEGHSGEGAKS